MRYILKIFCFLFALILFIVTGKMAFMDLFMHWEELTIEAKMGGALAALFMFWISYLFMKCTFKKKKIKEEPEVANEKS